MQLSTGASRETKRFGFRLLLATQGASAFTDVLFRAMLGILAWQKLGATAESTVAAGGIVGFLVIQLILSVFAGLFADKFSKGTVITIARLVELGVIIFGAYALQVWLSSSGSLTPLYSSLVLMGLVMIFMSPARYGILPELLSDHELADGNGLMEALGAFSAGVALLVAPSVAAKVSAGEFGYLLILPGFALVSLFLSMMIPRPSPANPTTKLIYGADPWRLVMNLRVFLENPKMFAAVAGLALFWGVSVIGVLNTFHYGTKTLELESNGLGMSLLLVAVAGGLSIGCFSAGRFSVGFIELGLVSLGACLWVIASIGLALTANFYIALLFLAIGGIGSGWYLVPLNSFLQKLSPPKERGCCIATANLLSVGGMLSFAVLHLVLSKFLGVGPRSIFFVAGLAVGILAYLIARLLPDFFVRAVVFLMTRLVYRIKIEGLENIPTDGPAVLVLNHTSYVDGNLVVSVVKRFVRFVVYQGHYDIPFLRWLGETFNAIPVDSQAPPKEILRALRKASDALENGEVLCVFAEGGITRTGFMLPFQRGFEIILRHAKDVPIIPGHIDGMWGSIFSFQRGKFFWKWPNKLPYPVMIKFGKPMPAQSTAFEVREQVQLLGVDCFMNRNRFRRPVHRQFIHAAKKFSRRYAMVDKMTPKMTYGEALMRSVIFARLLKRKLSADTNVGIFLPPTCGTALANIALSYLGKVPINLNYTVGEDVLNTCIEQAGIKQVLTSKKFLEKIPLRPNAELILLDDLREGLTTKDKLVGLLARYSPAWFIEHAILGIGSHKNSDLATIVFSSGSTGVPKGVMLTHTNVGSNIESVWQMVDANETDNVLAILPIFHSFGYTVTFWLPLMIGSMTVYHTSPLEAEIIGELCREHKVTIMVATGTFLRNFLRRCDKEDFKAMRMLVCGAEKLDQRLADLFEKTYGIRPLEGYGCTELSPAVSANRPDFVMENYRQVGNKPGTIGHPMPGQAVRIVDPESWEPLPLGTEGMLIVKGPNVMKGYLDRPDLTAQVIRDGWYATGDIGKIDEDGFVTLTDRLSRFSKIAGEMVPHGKVEETIHDVLHSGERLCAVVGIPDEKKGERLVVLHVPLPIPVAELWEKLREQLPPIWLPAKQFFFEVPELPILGTGKLDLRQIKTIAMNRATVRE